MGTALTMVSKHRLKFCCGRMDGNRKYSDVLADLKFCLSNANVCFNKVEMFQFGDGWREAGCIFVGITPAAGRRWVVGG